MRGNDSTTRLLSAFVTGSTVRRAFRARAATPGPSESPDVARLRAGLFSSDPEVVARAAREFLELLEPESLAEAHRRAFDGAGPAAATRALRDAWDGFRHDRHRGTN